MPCRSLRGLRRGSSSVCSVRSLLFYWFWPLPSLFTQSMKHVAIHSYLKTGTEGLTNSFVGGGGTRGAGLAQAGPGGPPGSQAGGTPTTSTGKCLEGSSLAQVRLHSSAGEWTWAQAGLGNLSSWLYLHGGGPGVVWGRALSGQRSSGSRQAGGSRLSTAPAHLQTANGPPPRSEVPRPREPRGASSGFRFLTAAFHLIASFPTSDSAVSTFAPFGLCLSRALSSHSGGLGREQIQHTSAKPTLFRQRGQM